MATGMIVQADGSETSSLVVYDIDSKSIVHQYNVEDAMMECITDSTALGPDSCAAMTNKGRSIVLKLPNKEGGEKSIKIYHQPTAKCFTGAEDLLYVLTEVREETQFKTRVTIVDIGRNNKPVWTSGDQVSLTSTNQYDEIWTNMYAQSLS